MNNQLVKVMSTSEVMSMADMFFKSGLFKDVTSMAQCVVKIQAGAEIGLPPFASMTGISVIKGKPVIGAGVMASKIKSSPKYDYKVVELSNTTCSIDFLLNGELIDNSTFTIEDAKRAGTGAGDNGSGKMIDKFPKNMLFARALSNGVKFYCPDLFFTSFYEPGEMGLNVDEDGNATGEEDNTILGIDNLLTQLEKLNIGQLEEFQSVKNKYLKWLQTKDVTLNPVQQKELDTLLASTYDTLSKGIGVVKPEMVSGKQIAEAKLKEESISHAEIKEQVKEELKHGESDTLNTIFSDIKIS